MNPADSKLHTLEHFAGMSTCTLEAAPILAIRWAVERIKAADQKIAHLNHRVVTLGDENELLRGWLEVAKAAPKGAAYPPGLETPGG